VNILVKDVAEPNSRQQYIANALTTLLYISIVLTVGLPSPTFAMLWLDVA